MHTRISPEAPVPVVKRDRETDTAGGAANVAANAASLGAAVELAGAIGRDANGGRLLAHLAGRGIKFDRGFLQDAPPSRKPGSSCGTSSSVVSTPRIHRPATAPPSPREGHSAGCSARSRNATR